MSFPPSDPNAVLRRALALHKAHRVDQAAALYRNLLQHFPANAQLLYLLGTAELQLGNNPEAVLLLARSLELAPNQPAALSNRADGLQNLERNEDALADYDRAIALKADYAEAHNGRGDALAALERFDDALAAYSRAAAIGADYAAAHNGRGNALVRLKRFDEALGAYRRAAAIAPDNAKIHTNCGNALRNLGRIEDARTAYDRAIALDPGFAPAYECKSFLQLLTGDLAAGWPLYERREAAEAFKNHPQNDLAPIWTGDTPLAGKTLLLRSEQGFGDMLQCCRYAPLAAAKGARVIVEASKPLLGLLTSLKGDFSFVEAGAPLPPADLQCLTMSLPLAFGTTLKTIPAEVPYLFADPAKRDAWRQRHGVKTKPRIGLAWSGNREITINGERSIPLKQLAPLLKLPFEFHAVQKDIRPVDAAILPDLPQLVIHNTELGDFSDTAALVAEMDMVISIDTAVAHLAGALGKTLWVLLSRVPDWRWLLDRSDCPWYPSATLLRQSEMGDWNGVIGEVCKRLETS